MTNTASLPLMLKSLRLSEFRNNWESLAERHCMNSGGQSTT